MTVRVDVYDVLAKLKAARAGWSILDRTGGGFTAQHAPAGASHVEAVRHATREAAADYISARCLRAVLSKIEGIEVGP